MINKVPFDGAGYLEVRGLAPHLQPFTWIWGGRGVGKTFGFLKLVRYDQPTPFLLLRRTQKQIDLLTKLNPFLPIDKLCGGLTACKKDGEVTVFYAGVLEDGKIQPAGPPVGYALALSTIHNIRGVNLDVAWVIYDEYIPEPHERPIKDEYLCFLNALETIGRNRELQGLPPMQFVGLSNANTLGNPYFLGMQIVRVVDRMLQRQQEIWEDPARGLMLINICRSPISSAKADTALYKLAGDGEFTAMALDNDFTGDHCSRQGSIPLQECDPVVTIGEITIYEHKRKHELLYCCDHRAGNPDLIKADDNGLKRFRRDYWWLVDSYLDGSILFKDILCEVLLKRYLNL